MHEYPPLALIPIPTSAVTASVQPDLRRPLVFYGLGIASLASIGLFVAAMPVFLICIIAVCAFSSFGLASHVACRANPAALAIAPESILSHELRETYRSVLFALAELDRTIAEAPQLRRSVAPVLERARAMVTTCGRLARLAEPLQRYLDGHDPVHLQWELDRLRARTEAARDDATIVALTRAAAARESQLATRDQIAGQRDRTLARLELVRASLESFTAMIVKLNGTGEEQLLLAGESMADHLDEIGGELDALESVLETDLPSGAGPGRTDEPEAGSCEPALAESAR